MDRETFDSEIEGLFNYFQARQPQLKTLDLWFINMQGIKTKIFWWCIDKIKADYDLIPRNIPKTFAVLAQDYYAQFPEQEFEDTQYDYKDDNKYPVAKQWSAYKILCKSKNDRAKHLYQNFNYFCDNNKMPVGRREAVLNKFKLIELGETYEKVFGIELAKKIKSIKRNSIKMTASGLNINFGGTL
jgi:hypothetical protein